MKLTRTRQVIVVFAIPALLNSDPTWTGVIVTFAAFVVLAWALSPIIDI